MHADRRGSCMLIGVAHACMLIGSQGGTVNDQETLKLVSRFCSCTRNKSHVIVIFYVYCILRLFVMWGM